MDNKLAIQGRWRGRQQQQRALPVNNYFLLIPVPAIFNEREIYSR